MSWQQLEMTIQPEARDPLSDALHDIGALAVTFLPDDARIQALFQADADIEDIIEKLSHSFELTDCRTKKVTDQDWQMLVQKDFKPLLIKDRLWICPSWHQAPDDGKPTVIVDPGLAFGTGKHPTTKLCLEWLCDHINGDETVIDFGCGSGILAIAALKLGASDAYATDIDAQALISTKDNALQNGIDTDALHMCFPDQLPEIKTDLLIANILANPLKGLRDTFTKFTKPGTKIGLSGILAEQLDDVTEYYQEKFDNIGHVNDQEWVRIDLRGCC